MKEISTTGSTAGTGDFNGKGSGAAIEATYIIGLAAAVSGLAGIVFTSLSGQIRALKAENRALKGIIAANDEAMRTYMKVSSEEGDRWEA